MSATVCCLFFWWQKKNLYKREQTKNSFAAKQRLKIASKIPVIRSEDIVSFVLPATRKQKNSATVESQPSFTNESQPLNNAVNRTCSEPISANDTICPHRVNNKLLGPANLNLKLYSRDLETNELIHTSQAKIGFSLQFDSTRQLLTLKILGALNLPTRSKNVAPDPYVKIVILPERQIKCMTKTLKSNCNPLFNQVFELDVSGLLLNKTEILLMVRDRPETSCYERCVSRSVTLGQAIFSMADFDGVNHRRQVRWCLLENIPAISPHTDVVNAGSLPKAEMQISLLYRVWSDETKLISHGRIILELLQIRPASFIPSNQDKEKVTIKVLLYERGYLTSSRRTNSIRRDEATAALCQKFVFALQPRMLHEASCQIVLVTKSAIGTKRTLGRITLGHRHFFSTWANSPALTTGIDHWHDMAHRPGVSVERWHSII
ncbi:syptotagmin 56 [Daphnia sinensis]|uniref:Syptotagmin 56 n=1 Tax=Daphnia sinensis TaxID=1820382 RepID=A0AAD5PPX4_9CRUS|nr:syptotagmin 56 [Daphnia sinensis]KAI9550890.1 syptotagmin 56 [Daphnia sinensis]KAI9559491.1 syptotagmin 56 [Daphnia sinensis]